MRISISFISRSKQKGAALVIGMLLLLVLTLLAISGMNTATVELAMAGNTQHQLRAFHAAEAAIERAIVKATFDSEDNTPTVYSGTIGGETFTVSITRQLNGEPQDPEAAWGTSIDKFGVVHFEMVNEGVASRGANATTIQGMGQLVPKGSYVTAESAANSQWTN